MTRLRWPPVRFLRCMRCDRPLVSTRRAVAVDRWPGAIFCSADCLRRHDAGFEAVRAALGARRAP